MTVMSRSPTPKLSLGLLLSVPLRQFRIMLVAPEKLMGNYYVQVAFAEEILERHLAAAAKDLMAICRGESHIKGPEKEVVRVVLHRIHQCLSGAQSCLPDFEITGPKLSGKDLSPEKPRYTLHESHAFKICLASWCLHGNSLNISCLESSSILGSYCGCEGPTRSCHATPLNCHQEHRQDMYSILSLERMSRLPQKSDPTVVDSILIKHSYSLAICICCSNDPGVMKFLQQKVPISKEASYR